ncbi:MAG: hypothetical protein ACKERG_03375 [Candidatus Hodgkinia cicadicola]
MTLNTPVRPEADLINIPHKLQILNNTRFVILDLTRCKRQPPPLRPPKPAASLRFDSPIPKRFDSLTKSLLRRRRLHVGTASGQHFALDLAVQTLLGARQAQMVSPEELSDCSS